MRKELVLVGFNQVCGHNFMDLLHRYSDPLMNLLFYTEDNSLGGGWLVGLTQTLNNISKKLIVLIEMNRQFRK